MSQLNFRACSNRETEQLNDNAEKVENNSDTIAQSTVTIPAIALSRQESLKLLRELAQLGVQQQEKLSFTISVGKSSERLRLERIQHLEKALEQSLNYLHELKQQMKDQRLLETQLAAAEEVTNLQQRAIAQLQQQLVQQQLLQTQLQQVYEELEQERNHTTKIEQQNCVLQEQIIQQSQQAQEYEAAVLFWKELALKLKGTLVQISPDLAVEFPEEIELAQIAVKTKKTRLKTQSQVDLPPFLK